MNFPTNERRAGKRADDAGRHTGSIHAFPKSVPDYLFPKSADADGETGKVRRFPMGGFGTLGDPAEWPGLGESGPLPRVPFRQTTGAVEKRLCGRGGQCAVEGSVMAFEQLGRFSNGRALANQAFA